MKPEKEIQEEIEATQRTIQNYRNAYKEGKIPKDVLETQLIDCSATIGALRWVLGKNERYD
ncbi:hypothetical protein [Clostridium sp. HBUAS56017]|uniref:hypothetical protein n=1 Tax=Clostridium sp. HBUAS56017 TaxID=2571128 RepID=UPI001177F333|nr:hypothetical protein [Clostridium sp. HBUAS56017]